MNKVEEFYTMAKKFCLAVSDITIDYTKAEMLMVSLMEIYVLCLSLPQTEPDDSDEEASSNEKPIRVKIADVYKCYWEVFDPFTCEDPVCCGIQDDLNDICLDLQEGITSYEQGRIDNAVWLWKWGLDNHWGLHVVDILRALHKIRCDKPDEQ